MTRYQIHEEIVAYLEWARSQPFGSRTDPDAYMEHLELMEFRAEKIAREVEDAGRAAES